MTYPPSGHQTQSLGDLDQVDERGVVPLGTYLLRPFGVQMKTTKAGDGELIEAKFEIADGQYRGMQFTDTFNVRNPNPQTVQIALRHIKQWIVAAGQDARGQLTYDRVIALEGHPVWAKVKIESDRSGQYDDKNRVQRFIAPDAAATAAPPAPPAPMHSAAAPAPVAPATAPTQPTQPTVPQPTYSTPPGASVPPPAPPAQPATQPAAGAPPAVPPAAAPAAPPPPATAAPAAPPQPPAPPAGAPRPWETGQ